MNNREKLFIVKHANAVRRFLQLLQTSKNPVKLLNQSGQGVTTYNRGGTLPAKKWTKYQGGFDVNGRELDFRELKKLLGQGSTVWDNAKRVGMPRKTTMMPNHYRNPGGPLDRAGLGGPENMRLDRGILDNNLANKNPLV